MQQSFACLSLALQFSFFFFLDQEQIPPKAKHHGIPMILGGSITITLMVNLMYIKEHKMIFMRECL